MNKRPLIQRLPALIGPVSYVSLGVICAVVLTVGAVFFIWQRYQYVRLGFEVNQLHRERTRLLKEIEPLELEVEYLSRPARIDNLARKMGLRPPLAGQITLLEEAGDEPLGPAN